MPAPVIVTKDVGGYVADYQTQTELYRATGREVRLHECRSACTLALSLPNVCVYPDSILKFHQAYDPRNHQSNDQVSRQLFDSYPAAIRARLGTLTRDYKVLHGSELIALGVRNCNEPKPSGPRTMVASTAAHGPAPASNPAGQTPLLSGLFDKVLSIFGTGQTAAGQEQRSPGPRRPGTKPAPALALLASIPLPPPRPPEFGPQMTAAAAFEDKPQALPPKSAMPLPTADKPLPPDTKPMADRRPPFALPAIMRGAQPVLPAGFSAYAQSGR